jgi:VanZ family protein
MAGLFYASSLSEVGPAGRIPDWLSHGAAYLILAVLLCRAVAGGLRPLSGAGALLAVSLSTAYGVTDEYHQSLVPGRDAAPADVAKDLGGAALGALAFRRLVARLAPRRAEA